MTARHGPIPLAPSTGGLRDPAARPTDENRESISERPPTLRLKDNDAVVIVGGGPSGAFFAIRLLKEAGRRGLDIDVLIIEKKDDSGSCGPAFPCAFREGCNYCAGGISPRLTESLGKEGLVLPREIVAGTIKSLTVHGHWKNIELRIPEDKEMKAVFRGSRPKGRANQHQNFDSFLLQKAEETGARIISGEVFDAGHSAAGRPFVRYRFFDRDLLLQRSVEADFLVLAGGVNTAPGTPHADNPFWRVAAKVIPGYRPPRIRKALIGEVEVKRDVEGFLEGEIYFVEYGSPSLKIEMSSLIPKGRYITAVLLGPSVDRAGPGENLPLLGEYLDLPQIKRILPPGAETRPACLCNPNMTVGAAEKPVGHRAAVVGDLAWAKLYKDGIHSAYLTASSLAEAALEGGVDARSLGRSYGRSVRRLSRDNAFGRIVFLLNRVVFSRPALSRILYQAVLTERKNTPQRARRLARILWNIASGDESYRSSLGSMFLPAAVLSIFVGGFLVTIRNLLTERLFNLRWKEMGRYPTGLHKEDTDKKKREMAGVLGAEVFPGRPKFESIYSISLKSDRRAVWEALGTFGDADRAYFRPRFLKVERTAGRPNEPGCSIRYRTPFKFLDFQVVLEKRLDDRYLIYRVENGFARGGCLVFNIEDIQPAVCVLSIFVAFDIARGNSPAEKVWWSFFRLFFPGFVHDVLWNHSLCQLKDLIEHRPPPGRPARGRRPSRADKKRNRAGSLRTRKKSIPPPTSPGRPGSR